MHRELSTPPGDTARACRARVLTQATGSGACVLKPQEHPHKKPDLEERGPAGRRCPNYCVEAYDSPSLEMVPS